ncbi:alkanesulfonate monooxygenase SsuD/methylene tetrahydromethanopterin reductase-like flavin-dependent oxidoreductase (luciferase family) [Sediminihabitans luteus]|uniref:Alkanesulfonate monooxygenase SsuD/methylene tetrahydromethanopterin reductase-like flavin-dependent oxidoreductase (Luciferase family) n=1 Tax=Sediminihabitans luteus TaxID=1138585 RepID=A0A2M9CER2_9CELL|nr:LLM class flavin-dependent oxidoreductase [Sediminihabitans luteus]PJJ70352.1 alkanesulfonate monooxygenase SsuD/methylene tetrahydromethanopterin reductase-like flavin-dependent oxidoreductase (luciferase family) [Sediminihabitans luteus]GII97824.1 luciferase [Sediminihabitans luteus]
MSASGSPQISTVILPVHPWSQGRAVWERAEQLGFGTAYTYDHLSWRTFRDGPWFGAVPLLTAAAVATTTLRLGTLVTSPNFREPVTLAKDLMTLDDVSGGRVTLGIGAGTSSGFDATVLGGPAWPLRERTERFEEFVELLDRLLTTPAVTSDGTYYSAHEARTIPGCVQSPRLPFVVAGNGPRGMRLAARHGQGWVTTGAPGLPDDASPVASSDAVAAQVARLREVTSHDGPEVAGGDAARDPLRTVLLTGFTPDPWFASADAFDDALGRYAEAGIDEVVLHWPLPGTQFDVDVDVFEDAVTRHRGA